MQGLKGVGAKIICLEEASRLDQAVFQEVIVPLLGVKDTAVLGISTPLDDTNFYSQMTEMKQEDGTLLFNVITISLICEECAGKDLKGQITCPHKQSEIPPWKTQRRQDLVKKLLENNPEMYKREQLGVISRNENNAFPADKVTVFEQTCRENASAVDYLFCCIDPAGGGSSYAAILTGYLFNNRSEVMVRTTASGMFRPTHALFYRFHPIEMYSVWRRATKSRMLPYMASNAVVHPARPVLSRPRKNRSHACGMQRVAHQSTWSLLVDVVTSARTVGQ